MHEYNIKEMRSLFTDKLEETDLSVNISNLANIFEEVVKEYFKDKIADVWYIHDVLEFARDLEVELSDKEAQEILERLLNKFDASVGINWNVIECHILDYV